MVFLFQRYRKECPAAAISFRGTSSGDHPAPSYNEMYVMERVIDAVCAFDYPKDKLDIQVLDDSTDETQEIAAERGGALEQQGPGHPLHSTAADRTGFKAGALENGLRTAKGEFVAIFRRGLHPGIRLPAPDDPLLQPIPKSGWCRRDGSTSIAITPS